MPARPKLVLGRWRHRGGGIADTDIERDARRNPRADADAGVLLGRRRCRFAAVQPPVARRGHCPSRAVRRARAVGVPDRLQLRHRAHRRADHGGRRAGQPGRLAHAGGPAAARGVRWPLLGAAVRHHPGTRRRRRAVAHDRRQQRGQRRRDRGRRRCHRRPVGRRPARSRHPAGVRHRQPGGRSLDRPAAAADRAARRVPLVFRAAARRGPARAGTRPRRRRPRRGGGQPPILPGRLLRRILPARQPGVRRQQRRRAEMVGAPVPGRGPGVPGRHHQPVQHQSHDRGGARRPDPGGVPRRPHHRHRQLDEDLRGRRHGRRQGRRADPGSPHRWPGPLPLLPHAGDVAADLVPPPAPDGDAADPAGRPQRTARPRPAGGDRADAADHDGAGGIPQRRHRPVVVRRPGRSPPALRPQDPDHRGPGPHADRLRPAAGRRRGAGPPPGHAGAPGRRGGRDAAQRQRRRGDAVRAAGVRAGAGDAELLRRAGWHAGGLHRRRRVHRALVPRLHREGQAGRHGGAHGGLGPLRLAGGPARRVRPARQSSAVGWTHAAPPGCPAPGWRPTARRRSCSPPAPKARRRAWCSATATSWPTSRRRRR